MKTLFSFEKERQMYRAFADYGYIRHGQAAVAMLLIGRLAWLVVGVATLLAVGCWL